jgi:hypothetical protein
MHASIPFARTLGSWLLLVFALLLSSTAWAQRDEGPYQIQQAVNGTDQSSMDVTDRLRQLAARDQRFRLTNDLFNADPAPGERKTLRIFARGPDGQPHTFDFSEYSWVDGAQFRGWSSGRWGHGARNPGWQSGGYGNADRDHDDILQATYGTQESRFDVTQRIRQLVRAQQRFQLNNALFNGDPARGQRKTLQIVLRGDGGQPQVLEFAEGSWIDGSRLSAAIAGPQDPRDQNSPRGRRDDGGGYWPVYVQRALYGDGYRQVDITARLRSQVRDGRLEVPVNNQLAGIDPAPGARKRLTVEFSLGNGPVQQASAQEGQWLRLP